MWKNLIIHPLIHRSSKTENFTKGTVRRGFRFLDFFRTKDVDVRTTALEDYLVRLNERIPPFYPYHSAFIQNLFRFSSALETNNIASLLLQHKSKIFEIFGTNMPEQEFILILSLTSFSFVHQLPIEHTKTYLKYLLEKKPYRRIPDNEFNFDFKGLGERPYLFNVFEKLLNDNQIKNHFKALSDELRIQFDAACLSACHYNYVITDEQKGYLAVQTTICYADFTLICFIISNLVAFDNISLVYLQKVEAQLRKNMKANFYTPRKKINITGLATELLSYFDNE